MGVRKTTYTTFLARGMGLRPHCRIVCYGPAESSFLHSLPCNPPYGPAQNKRRQGNQTEKGAPRDEAMGLGLGRIVFITRTAHSKAPIVRGAGYDVDRVRPHSRSRRRGTDSLTDESHV